MSINENNLTSFFGNLTEQTYPMELAYIALCSGAHMDYRKDKLTGNDVILAFVPKVDGSYQSIEVTCGVSDSVAYGNRMTIYHSLGLERIANEKGNSNDTNNEILVQRLAEVLRTLGDNNYTGMFFEQDAADLREKLIKYYPEYMRDYDAVVESYKQAFAKTFDLRNAGKKDDEKKNRIMA